jgi:outer membrane receptor protein involved in Fe transport
VNTLRIDAAWFGSWVEDLIANVQNSQSTARPENISEARILGAEFAFRLSLIDLISLSGNYSYFNGVNFSDDDTYRGKKLPGRPVHEMYGRIDLFKTFDRIGFGGWFHADYSGKSYVNPYTFEGETAMHFFLGVGARLMLPKAGFTFTFEVKNITDALVFKNSEGDWLPMSDYDRYPLPGRTFLGTVHWQRPSQ